jgi:hypothetical protein
MAKLAGLARRETHIESWSSRNVIAYNCKHHNVKTINSPSSWKELIYLTTHFVHVKCIDCSEKGSEPGSSVSIKSRYMLGDRGSILGRGERIFPLASVSRPALAPIQPPVQWVPGVLSPGLKRGRGVTLKTHPHLQPMSRMSRSYIVSPPKRLRGV